MLKKDKNNFFIDNHKEERETFKNLPAGIYSVEEKLSLFTKEFYFENRNSTSNLVKINSGIFKEIYDHVMDFFNPETKQIYDDFKVKYKSASILYGSPGTGKTCLIQIITEELVKKIGAVCIYATPVEMCILAQYAREDESIPLVFILEEIDNYIDQNVFGNNKSIEMLLNFLDGFESVNNIYVLATTNHINKIGNNFKERPSRFERKFNLERIPQEVIQNLVPQMMPEKYHKKINMPKVLYELSERDIKIDQLKNILIKHVQGIPLEVCIDMFSDTKNKVTKKNVLEDENE